MNHILLRSLLLAGSFVLTLPQGWCSLAATASANEATVRSHGGCCDLCTCGDIERIPASPVEPPLPSRCCCYELNWLKPSDPVKVDVEFPFVETIVALPLHVTVDGVREPTDAAFPTPSRRLHLLHCVWLC